VAGESDNASRDRGWLIGDGLQYRHRDLCLEAQVQPLPVVLNFVDGMVATGNLARELVPSWEGEVPIVSQEKGSQSKGKGREAADDIEMLESDQEDTPRAMKTRKRVERVVLPIEVPIRSSQSKGTTSNEGSEAGVKRARPVTPEKEEPQSTKRPRAVKAVPGKQQPSTATMSGRVAKSARTVSAKVATVSLTGKTVAEFSEVSEELVPGVVGKVSRVRSVCGV